MEYSLVGDDLEWNARIKSPTKESYEVQMSDNSLLLRWDCKRALFIGRASWWQGVWIASIERRKTYIEGN